MIQAEIGGGARIDPGYGVQRPGFMIRDFTLPAADGAAVRISDFRGSSNLAVVFPGYSEAMRSFLREVVQHASQFSEQETTILVIALQDPDGKEDSIRHCVPVRVLQDKTHTAYRLSGASDESGCPVPLVYLTDRFGEIVSAYIAPDHAMPPDIREVLSQLEFANHQCPECEPPEWPR